MARIKHRLERLEAVLRVGNNSEELETRRREFMRSWMDKDPDAIPLFKRFENYCKTKLGFAAFHQKKDWVELTREDPVAAELAHAWLESYRNHVLTHFGVRTEEVGNV